MTPAASHFSDQPQHPLVRDPVPEELPQPVLIKLVEKVADIRVEHPVHLLPLDPHRQRIQRVMRASPRPEPVGEAQEVRLVDGVEHLDDGPLDDLVFQRGDARAAAAARPPSGCTPSAMALPGSARCEPGRAGPGGWPPGPARSPPMSPRPPRRGLRAQRPVGHHQPIQADMVQQRREPRVLIPSCHFTHTVQPAWRVMPGTASGTRCAVRVPLGQSPSLHRLRSRRPCSAASQVLRDCLTSHARASQAYRLGLPCAARPAITVAGEHGTSRFSRRRTPCMRRFSDRAGSASSSRYRCRRCCLPPRGTASAPRSGDFAAQ